MQLHKKDNMKINLTTNINGASQSVEAEIKGVNVYIETAFGRSVIQLKERDELAAIAQYAEVIQGMADAYAAVNYPVADDQNATVESIPKQSPRIRLKRWKKNKTMQTRQKQMLK